MEEAEIKEAFSLFSEPMEGEKEGVIPIGDVRRAMMYANHAPFLALPPSLPSCTSLLVPCPLLLVREAADLSHSYTERLESPHEIKLNSPNSPRSLTPKTKASQRIHPLSPFAR